MSLPPEGTKTTSALGAPAGASSTVATMIGLMQVLSVNCWI
jgi:hypothetical protein